MAFPRDEVLKLLVQCHRRCCICHRFCGVKIETDHIVPVDEGGGDEIGNAIAVCFECHAEIHSYNDQHPRGRKFLSEELRRHRDQWLRICAEHPETFVDPPRYSDVGPIQALIDELDFNERVARYQSSQEQGCLFHTQQFDRAIERGSIAVLREDLKNSVLEAYATMGSANQVIESAWRHQRLGAAWAEGVNEAQRRIRIAQPRITQARTDLVEFLKSEPES